MHLSNLNPMQTEPRYDQLGYSEYPSPPILPPQPKQHPTTNAQILVLSIAFFCVWSPQNLMAPNLTQMSYYFHFTPDQRDIILGANIAFATGVVVVMDKMLELMLARMLSISMRLSGH